MSTFLLDLLTPGVMAMLAFAAGGFLTACLLSAILTMVVRRIAPTVGLTDRPDAHRKLHGRPIALGGGIAVFLATATVLGIVLVVPNPWGLMVREDWGDALAFLLAMGGIVLLGAVDDRVGLRGRHKLLGQVVIAGVLMAGGLLIHRVGLFGRDIELGLLTVPVTLFWLVGATNAVNLLDGIDGLATTLGIILSLAIATMAAMTGHPAVAFVALVFAGSLVGFLRFNFPPASIFLGDAGSMLIGLMVAAMSVRASLKGPGSVLLAAPIAMLAIPILDSTVAILRRKLTGRSIYTTDRGHLHHQLLDRLGSNHAVLVCVAICCVLTSAMGLLSAALKNDLIALVSCLALVIVFITTGLFGRGEFLLLAGRLRNLGLSLVHPIPANGEEARQTAVQLQGSGRWSDLWEMLVRSAEELKLNKVQLDLNHPAAQEGFNAMWERPSGEDADRHWSLDCPLMMDGRPIGRLRLIGQGNHAPLCTRLEELVELVQPFEKEFQLLLETSVVRAPHGRGDALLAKKAPGRKRLATLLKRRS